MKFLTFVFAIFYSTISYSTEYIDKLNTECESGKTSSCDKAIKVSNELESCKAGEWEDCDNFLRRNGLFNSQGLEKYEYLELIKPFADSCKSGKTEYCLFLSETYERGIENVLPEDEVKAFKYEKLACDFKMAESCHSVALKYSLGSGVDENVELERKYYALACNLEYARSCLSLGKSYSYLDAPTDHHKARKYYDIGCDLGSGESCRQIGNNITDKTETLTFYVKGCEAGSADSCDLASYAYLAGLGTPVNDQKAAEFERKACHAGNDYYRKNHRSCDKFFTRNN